MTRSRPFGLSLIALLFLAEAILAVGVAAFLLLSPTSDFGVTTLVTRMDMPSALGSLLAVPPLLTAAVAGLVFRGLWDLREWARLGAIVFSFLLAFAAVALLAFFVAFEVGDAINLGLTAFALVLAAVCFIYLLTVGNETENPKTNTAAPKAPILVAKPQPAYVVQTPSAAPPAPRQDDAAPPYGGLVPPPPRPAASSFDRQAATTVASSSLYATQQLASSTAKPAAVETPIAWLNVRQGPQMSQEFTLYPHDILLLGRDRMYANGVLADPTISSRHARLWEEGGQVIIEDLGSTNGTLVNNKQVQRHYLQDGDEIRLGSTILTFTTPRP